MITVEPEKVAHIQRVDEIYRQSSSLQEAGDKLNLTRERVRQILAEGRKLKIINYVPSRKQAKNKFETLKNNYTRETFIKELIEAGSMKVVLGKLDLNRKSFEKLLDYFKIDEKELHTEKFRHKWLTKYQEIVDSMGRHPSTTELQGTSEGKTLYNAVCRYWGNFSEFRKEFGIEKEGYFMNEDTHASLLEALERGKVTRQDRKSHKKATILEYITENPEVSKTDLVKHFDMTDSSMSIYLNELEEEGHICKVTKELKNFYSIVASLN